MEQKNYTEVFIDGTVFTLGGTEDEAYLRQVAAYLNEKIGEVRKLDGFSRQSPEYQNLTIQLNLSDDYFKEQMRNLLLSLALCLTHLLRNLNHQNLKPRISQNICPKFFFVPEIWHLVMIV